MMRKTLIIFAVVMLTACAANPPIVQTSPGVFLLSRADKAGIFGNPSAFKAKVISDVNAFAASKGMVAVPVMLQTTPVAPGRFASVDYEFRLVPADDKAAQGGSVLLPKSDVSITIKQDASAKQ